MFDEKSFFGPGRSQLNVLGGVLESCSIDPITGFFRDGCCNWHPSDIGSHTVCARMTKDFLEFSKQQGNDLSTPIPEYDFAGLKEGDFWCLCASRWEEARIAKKAPEVVLESTNIKCLEILKIEDLTKYKFKKPESK
jgi:uncharacterized protein (DUF2237 family)